MKLNTELNYGCKRDTGRLASNMARQRYFILRIDSYTGKDTTRDQHEMLDEEGWNAREISALYAIVRIADNSAEIADDGYRSIKEAQQAWPAALPRQVRRTTAEAS